VKTVLLRVVGRGSTAFQRQAFRDRRHQISPRDALQFIKAASMIDMLMARQEDFNVRGAETEALDIRNDRGSGFGRRGVDQDVTFASCYQQYDNAAGPNVVDVGENADRRGRVAPTILTGTLPLMFGKAGWVCFDYSAGMRGSGRADCEIRNAKGSIMLMRIKLATIASIRTIPPGHNRYISKARKHESFQGADIKCKKPTAWFRVSRLGFSARKTVRIQINRCLKLTREFCGSNDSEGSTAAIRIQI
jgi:hypothetical protein